MGGAGSGRHASRDTTDQYRMLNVHRLQQGGWLQPGKQFNWGWKQEGKDVAFIHISTATNHLVLTYRYRDVEGAWRHAEYPLRMDWTPCTYGGRRPWFLCPARGCGRRVAILYLGEAGIFACRHCYCLAYPCQREDATDRLLRRLDAVQHQLGGNPSSLDGRLHKPKGMHWKTFEKLINEHTTLLELLDIHGMEQ